MRVARSVLALAVLAACASCTASDGGAERPPGSSTPARPGAGTEAAPATIDASSAWRMHPIDGRYRGANALGAADVDGDGMTDYITNYEFDQRWVVALHPGPEASPTEMRGDWPTVEVWRPEPLVSGNGKNPESTALGDVDGDGNVDAVGAHGFSDIVAFEGSAPGIHVVWGPEPSEVMDPAAWEDGGWVPATIDLGHPHWVVTHDVDGDGRTDVAFGGRRHGGGGGYDNPDSPNGNGTYTGIGWLEAPDDPASRRDLSAWELHRIAPDEPSGHGFTFADLDGDGDDDIVDANADFDTEQSGEDIAWYENPGDGTDAQERAWTRRSLFASDEFYAKPQVAVGDLDGDGDADLVSQTDQDLILIRSRGDDPLTFEPITVPKPQQARWLARPVRLADLDRDGDLDIVGMLLHEDNDLPETKASAFALLQEGDPFTEDGWRLAPIAWGSGTTMKLPGFGEKWDQVDVSDVDGDGDLDVVANCEEWWASAQFEAAPFFTSDLVSSSVAVVWFENPLGDGPPQATEVDGMIEVEAEGPRSIGDATWVERAPVRTATPIEGDERTAALQAHDGQPTPRDGVAAADTAGVTYPIDVEGGSYLVWARVFVPTAFSPDVGGASADSAWLVADDGEPLLLGDDDGATDEWRWVRLAEPIELDAGTHELHLRVREHGIAVDRLVLTTDPEWRPT